MKPGPFSSRLVEVRNASIVHCYSSRPKFLRTFTFVVFLIFNFIHMTSWTPFLLTFSS